MNALRTYSRVVRCCQSSVRHYSTDQPPPPRRSERGINEVRLLGRAGADAVLHTKDGDMDKSFCIFRMATNYEYYQKSGERVSFTDWHKIIISRPGIRDYAARIKKGDRVMVSGRLTARPVKDLESDRIYKDVSIQADELINFTNKARESSEDDHLQSYQTEEAEM